MTELRDYNVKRVYNEVVKCVIQDKIGVNPNFESYKSEIGDMISQVSTDENDSFILMKGHIRKDGEQWTPYLQPVLMIVQLAYRAGYVTYEGTLMPGTIIHVMDYEKSLSKK